MGVVGIECGIFRTLCRQKIILKAAVVYFRFVIVFSCTGAGFFRYTTAAS